MDTASVICGPELLLLRASREAYDMCIWLSWRSEELIQQSRESRARICWGGRCASVIRRGEGLSDAVLLSHTTSSRQLFFKINPKTGQEVDMHKISTIRYNDEIHSDSSLGRTPSILFPLTRSQSTQIAHSSATSALLDCINELNHPPGGCVRRMGSRHANRIASHLSTLGLCKRQ
jgi:hypothetical protein